MREYISFINSQVWSILCRIWSTHI